MAPNVSLLAESSVIEGSLYVRMYSLHRTETYKTDTVDQKFFEVMSRSKVLEAVVSAMKETPRWRKIHSRRHKISFQKPAVESGVGERSNDSLPKYHPFSS